MSTFTHEGITFNYKDEGQGQPVIYLHGLGGDLEQPFSYFPKSKKFRLISLDFRGHGKTRFFGSKEKFTFSVFAKDVIALANHLDLKQFIIGGISTGAGVALNISLHYPSYVQGLLLTRIAWEDKPQPEHIQGIFQEISDHIQIHGPSLGKKIFSKTKTYQDIQKAAPAVGDSLLAQFDYDFVRETHEKFVQIPKDSPNHSRKEWKTIKIPTLILANKIDPIHPFSYGELLFEYLENAIFKEIPSKSVSSDEHKIKSHQYILEFLENHYNGGIKR